VVIFTKMSPRKFWSIASLVIAAGIVFIVVALLIEMRYNESEQKLISYWKVHAININDKPVDLKNLKSKGLSFYKDNKMLLPKFKSYKGKLPITFSVWNYERIGLIDGQITIKDINQNIFSGVYNIEMSDFKDPQIIRLYSDSIEIYIQARERFSIDNPSIEAFNFNPTCYFWIFLFGSANAFPHFMIAFCTAFFA